MTDRPKVPSALASRITPNYRAMVAFYEQRARWGRRAPERERLFAEAERYRKLAQRMQEEAEAACRHASPTRRALNKST
jgi:hypothetical protein